MKLSIITTLGELVTVRDVKSFIVDDEAMDVNGEPFADLHDGIFHRRNYAFYQFNLVQ